MSKDLLNIKVDKKGNLTLDGEPVKERDGIINISKTMTRVSFMAKEYYIYSKVNKCVIQPDEEVIFKDGNPENYAPDNLKLKKRAGYDTKDFRRINNYRVYRNGKIVKLQPIKKSARLTSERYIEQPITIKNDRCYMLDEEDKYTTMIASRVVYSAFSGKNLSRIDKVIFKDGNPENRFFGNLKVVKLSTIDYLRGSHAKAKAFSREQVKEIQEQYASGGWSYRKLAKKHHCDFMTIGKIISGNYYKD